MEMEAECHGNSLCIPFLYHHRARFLRNAADACSGHDSGLRLRGRLRRVPDREGEEKLERYGESGAAPGACVLLRGNAVLLVHPQEQERGIPHLGRVLLHLQRKVFWEPTSI